MGLSTEQLVQIFFHEIPNKGAAIAALVLYVIVSTALTGISFKTRTYYMFTVAITGFLEVAGFSTRLLMLTSPSLKLYIAHQAFLIISPVLLAIVVYITLSRLLALSSVAATAEGTASSKQGFDVSKFVSWFFTCSDVFCLLLQSTGGALYGNPANANIARTLLLAGLGAQLGFFSCFIGLAIYVLCNKRYGYRADKQFRPVFVCVFATTLLMQGRNVFRVIEFAMGYNSYVATHEMFLYIFDFAPIYGCFLFFTFMHFGFWLGPEAPARRAKEGAALPQSQKDLEGQVSQGVMPPVRVDCM